MGLRQSFLSEAFYTMLGVVVGKACPAMRTALDDKGFVPARDVLLIREGIADYRYIYTLDKLVRDAEAKKLDAPAVIAACTLRDQLRAELSLDLTHYYESSTASYTENWHPRADNSWKHSRFQDTRRRAAEHISAIQAALR